MKPAVTWKPAAEGNFAKGRRSRISQITFHHIVGDAAGAISRFQTAGVQVSSTYVVGSDGTIYQCISDNDTPYTDANADSNARSITIEHAGGHPSVPYTEAMYAASIKLVRYLISTYSITSFKRHREVSDSPTACPGELDVERIIAAAKGATISKMTREEVIWCYRLAFGADPSETEIKNYEGDEYEVSQKEIQRYALNNGLSFWTYRKKAEAQIADLQARLATGSAPPTIDPRLEALGKALKDYMKE